MCAIYRWFLSADWSIACTFGHPSFLGGGVRCKFNSRSVRVVFRGVIMVCIGDFYPKLSLGPLLSVITNSHNENWPT
jgi:hypothetical protein